MFARSILRRQQFYARQTAANIAANTSNATEGFYGEFMPFARMAAIPAAGFLMNVWWPQERKISEKTFL